MTDETSREPARDPQELERFLVARQRAGNVEGMMALFESEAAVDCGGGRFSAGRAKSGPISRRWWRAATNSRWASSDRRGQRRPGADLDAASRRPDHLRGRAPPTGRHVEMAIGRTTCCEASRPTWNWLGSVDAAGGLTARAFCFDRRGWLAVASAKRANLPPPGGDVAKGDEGRCPAQPSRPNLVAQILGVLGVKIALGV